MSKKHNEIDDLKSIKNVATIDSINKIITVKKQVGISLISKLDFLQKCCGYNVIYKIKQTNDDDFDSINVSLNARTKNAHNLTNKNK